MIKAKAKHMFPGGNTSLGFYSYYNYILPQDEASRIFIIKGGPGVGKSTFMKKVAIEMEQEGYEVEYMHCSSDPNSLDGIVIPEIKVALMDGTAPHIVDPKNPGAIDEIINLGDFWDVEKIQKNREAIFNDNFNFSGFFNRAYRYIKAAAQIHEDTAAINQLAVDKGRVNIISSDICEEIFLGKDISYSEGKTRKLFASAITPEGQINYLESILSDKKIYKIIGDQGLGANIILEKVKKQCM